MKKKVKTATNKKITKRIHPNAALIKIKTIIDNAKRAIDAPTAILPALSFVCLFAFILVLTVEFSSNSKFIEVVFFPPKILNILNFLLTRVF